MHRTRIALLASLLIALAVAAGQALAGIPNIELITFVVFVAGFLLGPVPGMIVGAVGIGGHSLFNVMGAVVPPMLIVQVLSYAGVGLAGATLGRFIAGLRHPMGASIVAGLVGATLTFIYQLAINTVAFYTFSSAGGLWPYIWGGLVFSVVHIGWNALLFSVSMRPTLAVLRRYQLTRGQGEIR